MNYVRKNSKVFTFTSIKTKVLNMISELIHAEAPPNFLRHFTRLMCVFSDPQILLFFLIHIQFLS